MTGADVKFSLAISSMPFLQQQHNHPLAEIADAADLTSPSSRIGRKHCPPMTGRSEGCGSFGSDGGYVDSTPDHRDDEQARQGQGHASRVSVATRP